MSPLDGFEDGAALMALDCALGLAALAALALAALVCARPPS